MVRKLSDFRIHFHPLITSRDSTSEMILIKIDEKWQNDERVPMQRKIKSLICFSSSISIINKLYMSTPWWIKSTFRSSVFHIVWVLLHSVNTHKHNECLLTQTNLCKFRLLRISTAFLFLNYIFFVHSRVFFCFGLQPTCWPFCAWPKILQLPLWVFILFQQCTDTESRLDM